MDATAANLTASLAAAPSRAEERACAGSGAAAVFELIAGQLGAREGAVRGDEGAGRSAGPRAGNGALSPAAEGEGSTGGSRRLQLEGFRERTTPRSLLPSAPPAERVAPDPGGHAAESSRTGAGMDSGTGSRRANEAAGRATLETPRSQPVGDGTQADRAGTQAARSGEAPAAGSAATPAASAAARSIEASAQRAPASPALSSDSAAAVALAASVQAEEASAPEAQDAGSRAANPEARIPTGPAARPAGATTPAADPPAGSGPALDALQAAAGETPLERAVATATGAGPGAGAAEKAVDAAARAAAASGLARALPAAAPAPAAQAAPASPAPAAQPRPAWLALQVAQALRVTWLAGRREAVVTLDPPELGQVRIQLRVEDKRVFARVGAARSDVERALRAEESSLREGLARQGLRLETLIVDRLPGTPARAEAANARAEASPSSGATDRLAGEAARDGRGGPAAQDPQRRDLGSRAHRRPLPAAHASGPGTVAGKGAGRGRRGVDLRA